MKRDDIAVFGLSASRAFAEGVAAALGVPLAAHEERAFEDGEHKARPLESVRGRPRGSTRSWCACCSSWPA